jgi:pimeloyl-ACP methyl ester carboxylesterase
MKSLLRLLLHSVFLAPSFPTYSSSPQDCVIVLHGLGRTAFSMSLIEDALTRGNYLVWNEGYPSTSGSIEELSGTTIREGLAFCDHNKAAAVHFVTHSLGGILVRQYLQHNTISNLGRIVMLSPPNHGSEVADLLKDYTIYRFILGPAAQQLGTDKGGLTEELGPVKGEIGIITGVSSSDPWFSPVIPGDDDGKVSVESAKLEEMSDFLTVPNGHTFIMRDETVIEQILNFIREGNFSRAELQQTHD